jgi:hypothetical protein
MTHREKRERKQERKREIGEAGKGMHIRKDKNPVGYRSIAAVVVDSVFNS